MCGYENTIVQYYTILSRKGIIISSLYHSFMDQMNLFEDRLSHIPVETDRDGVREALQTAEQARLRTVTALLNGREELTGEVKGYHSVKIKRQVVSGHVEFHLFLKEADMTGHFVIYEDGHVEQKRALENVSGVNDADSFHETSGRPVFFQVDVDEVIDGFSEAT